MIKADREIKALAGEDEKNEEVEAGARGGDNEEKSANIQSASTNESVGQTSDNLDLDKEEEAKAPDVLDSLSVPLNGSGGVMFGNSFDKPLMLGGGMPGGSGGGFGGGFGSPLGSMPYMPLNLMRSPVEERTRAARPPSDERSSSSSDMQAENQQLWDFLNSEEEALDSSKVSLVGEQEETKSGEPSENESIDNGDTDTRSGGSSPSANSSPSSSLSSFSPLSGSDDLEQHEPNNYFSISTAKQKNEQQARRSETSSSSRVVKQASRL